MTKGELLNLLSDYEDEEEVVFLYPAGDYWHNVIAQTPRVVDMAEIRYSEYHQHDILADENDPAEGNNRRMVITLQ